MICPHCQTPIATPVVGRGMVARGAYRLHVAACRKKSPAERAYFKQFHEWPRRGRRRWAPTTPTPNGGG